MVLEYAYQTDPNSADDAINIFHATSQLGGAVLNLALGSGTLDPNKKYYTHTLRLPKSLPLGVTLEVQSTQNLPDFDDGSSTVLPYGEPFDEGDNTVLQGYYQVEDMEMQSRGFIRLKVSLG